MTTDQIATEAAKDFVDHHELAQKTLRELQPVLATYLKAAIEKATADLEDKLQKERIEAGVIFQRLSLRAAQAGEK